MHEATRRILSVLLRQVSECIFCFIITFMIHIDDLPHSTFYYTYWALFNSLLSVSVLHWIFRLTIYF